MPSKPEFHHIRTFENLKIKELTVPSLYAACVVHRTNNRRGGTCWPLMLLLEAPGNPDHQQYTQIAEPRVVLGDDLKALVAEAAGYRDTNQLGGGNWGLAGGGVYRTDTCKLTHVIYYNGRVVPAAESRYVPTLSTESGFAAWVRTAPSYRARYTQLLRCVRALAREIGYGQGTSVSRAHVVAQLTALADNKEA